MTEPKQIFCIARPDNLYPWGLRMRLGWRHEDGSMIVAEPVTFRSYRPEEPVIGEPMISEITPEGAQCLMDELWKAGVRPSDIGTAGHLQATQKHLDDMRALVGAYTKAPLL